MSRYNHSVDIDNQDAYRTSLELLKEHKRNIRGGFKGRFIQIFFGLKFFQNTIPSMFSGSYISSEVIQTLLDDLYSKNSRKANACVLSLFEAKYLARTGVTGVNNNTAQNTWRNNLNLQKGIGCYATANDLSSDTFLEMDRVKCPYLLPKTPKELSGASCSFCSTQARYRGENHRKWLKIDASSNGYSVTDLYRIHNFIPYIAPNKTRIPILPFIYAVYFDSDPGLVIGNRRSVDPLLFMSDFNLTQEEYVSYFDDSLDNPLNKKAFDLIESHPVDPEEGAGKNAMLLQKRKLRPANREPVLRGTAVIPPAVNTGWDAEQYVASALTLQKWDTHVVSRQLLGYDIFAQLGRKKMYIEVKAH